MEVIEVFKTSVTTRIQADMLVNEIHKKFACYKANFDLDDCDKILRIKSGNGSIERCIIINILNDFGFNAEVLPDDLQVHERLRSQIA